MALKENLETIVLFKYVNNHASGTEVRWSLEYLIFFFSFKINKN